MRKITAIALFVTVLLLCSCSQNPTVNRDDFISMISDTADIKIYRPIDLTASNIQKAFESAGISYYCGTDNSKSPTITYYCNNSNIQTQLDIGMGASGSPLISKREYNSEEDMISYIDSHMNQMYSLGDGYLIISYGNCYEGKGLQYYKANFMGVFYDLIYVNGNDVFIITANEDDISSLDKMLDYWKLPNSDEQQCLHSIQLTDCY